MSQVQGQLQPPSAVARDRQSTAWVAQDASSQLAKTVVNSTALPSTTPARSKWVKDVSLGIKNTTIQLIFEDDTPPLQRSKSMSDLGAFEHPEKRVILDSQQISGIQERLEAEALPIANKRLTTENGLLYETTIEQGKQIMQLTETVQKTEDLSKTRRKALKTLKKENLELKSVVTRMTGDELPATEPLPKDDFQAANGASQQESIQASGGASSEASSSWTPACEQVKTTPVRIDKDQNESGKTTIDSQKSQEVTPTPPQEGKKSKTKETKPKPKAKTKTKSITLQNNEDDKALNEAIENNLAEEQSALAKQKKEDAATFSTLIKDRSAGLPPTLSEEQTQRLTALLQGGIKDQLAQTHIDYKTINASDGGHKGGESKKATSEIEIMIDDQPANSSTSNDEEAAKWEEISEYLKAKAIGPPPRLAPMKRRELALLIQEKEIEERNRPTTNTEKEAKILDQVYKFMRENINTVNENLLNLKLKKLVIQARKDKVNNSRLFQFITEVQEGKWTF